MHYIKIRDEFNKNSTGLMTRIQRGNSKKKSLGKPRRHWRGRNRWQDYP
jgi:hypothetical protein